MAGKIRTKEKCPKCKAPFKGEPLGCASCKTHPRKYYIIVYAKGRGTIKIYSDRRGFPLDSWPSAERVLTRIRSEIEDNSFDPTRWAASDLKKSLFENCMKSWLADKLVDAENGNLSRGYIDLLEYFNRAFYEPHFKGTDVRDVRGFHIQEFYRKMPSLNKKKKDKKISLKHRKNIMDGLRAFFNDLKRQEHIESVPSFPVITVDRKAPKWIDYETQIETLKLIPPEHRPIITFLAFQGVRPGEARALKVRDLDLKKGVMIICRTFSGSRLHERTKGKVVRPRLINPALIETLVDACKDKHPDAFVFALKGQPYTKSQLWHIWNATRKKAGLDITLYQATRHSVASIAISEGASVSAIKDVLGHTDIRTTMLYAHANLESQKTVFRRQAAVLEMVPQKCPEAENGE